MTRSDNVEKVIAKVGDLPAMPEVVADVLRITEKPDSDMTEVGARLEQDPALTAKILKISNSPYYGMKQYVGTLKLALVILGVREVRNIVLGISMFDTLRSPSTEALLAGDYWKHSVGVAGMAKKLSVRMGYRFQGEDFISGLLHDVGKLVLWGMLGEEYIEIYDDSGGVSTKLCDLEEIRLGFNHAEAGAALASKWNLPLTLVDSILMHHRAEDMHLQDAKDPCLAAIVRISDLAVRDFCANPSGTQWTSCEEDDTWAFLENARQPILQEERREVFQEFCEELKDVPAISL